MAHSSNTGGGGGHHHHHAPGEFPSGGPLTCTLCGFDLMDVCPECLEMVEEPFATRPPSPSSNGYSGDAAVNVATTNNTTHNNNNINTCTIETGACHHSFHSHCLAPVFMFQQNPNDPRCPTCGAAWVCQGPPRTIEEYLMWWKEVSSSMSTASNSGSTFLSQSNGTQHNQRNGRFPPPPPSLASTTLHPTSSSSRSTLLSQQSGQSAFAVPLSQAGA